MDKSFNPSTEVRSFSGSSLSLSLYFPEVVSKVTKHFLSTPYRRLLSPSMQPVEKSCARKGFKNAALCRKGRSMHTHTAFECQAPTTLVFNQAQTAQETWTELPCTLGPCKHVSVSQKGTCTLCTLSIVVPPCFSQRLQHPSGWCPMLLPATGL